MRIDPDIKTIGLNIYHKSLNRFLSKENIKKIYKNTSVVINIQSIFLFSLFKGEN